jgi:hypothetical protein
MPDSAVGKPTVFDELVGEASAKKPHKHATPKTRKPLWPAGYESSESKPRGQVPRSRGKKILKQL